MWQSAQDSFFGVNSGCVGFIIRMLRFNHFGFTYWMYPIFKLFFVIIFFDVFGGHPLCPRESQIRRLGMFFRFFIKIIFHVTLGTNQRTHFVVGRFFDVLSLIKVGFNQCRTCYGKIHGFRIVAISTTNWIDNFGTQFFERRFIKLGNSFLAM